jgi:hypothetical protein
MGGIMTTGFLSYAELAARIGRPFTDDAGTELVLEQLTRPWTCDGQVTYSLLLTGPVESELPAGVHRLADGEVTLAVLLEPVARDIRHIHYEACVCRPVDEEPFSFFGRRAS